MASGQEDYYTPSEQLADILTSLGSDLEGLTEDNKTLLTSIDTLMSSMEDLLDSIDTLLTSQESILEAIRDQDALGGSTSNTFQAVSVGAGATVKILAAWTGRTRAVVHTISGIAQPFKIGITASTATGLYLKILNADESYEFPNYRGDIYAYNQNVAAANILVAEW